MRKLGHTLKLYNCPREVFLDAMTTHKEDAFANTFVAKADMLAAWDRCIGVFVEGVLCAAIITTISKTNPRVANLQLLHTFYMHRGSGAARKLCEAALVESRSAGAEYFRVSSEPSAVGFYEKLGFHFWGKQKSGCSLSVFKFSDAGHIYDDKDPVIHRALYSGRKGALACSYTTHEPSTLNHDA